MNSASIVEIPNLGACPTPPAAASLDERLQALDILGTPVWVLDIDRNRMLWGNQAALAFWQVDDRDALRARDVGHDMSTLVHRRLLQYQLALGEGQRFEEVWTFFPAGVPRATVCRFSGYPLENGSTGLLVEVLQNEPGGGDSQRLVEAAHLTPAMITLYRVDGRPLDANRAARELLGGLAGRDLGARFTDLTEGRTVLAGVQERGAVRGEFRMQTGRGTRWHRFDARTGTDPVTGQRMIVVTETDASGQRHTEATLHASRRALEQRVREQTLQIEHTVRELDREVRERRAAEAEAQRLAERDGLTGLANRVLLHARMEQVLARAREQQRRPALLFVDLDRFKTINDSTGHLAGDQLLQGVAARLLECAGEGDVVARLGGDEFVVLLDHVSGPERAAEIALRIRESLRPSFRIESRQIDVSASIGISVYPEDGSDGETLLRNADAAMYQAKQAGRDNFQYYCSRMAARVADRVSLESDLRQALVREELVLCYQPRIALHANRVCGAEVLVRWQHPTRGLLGPDTFIPIAEDSGLIHELGDWVLRHACHQNRMWLDRGLAALPLSVNLSPTQFRRPDLANRVAAMLADCGLDAHYLELELTEGLLMQNAADVVAVLRSLHERGIRLSVDDFGTGYSNLAYLKRFPIDSLKIDRSFIREIPYNTEDTVICQTIIAMAQNLELGVVAEGVEHMEQLEWLRLQGCDEFQGYIHSKPLCATAFGRLLQRGRDNALVSLPGNCSP